MELLPSQMSSSSPRSLHITLFRACQLGGRVGMCDVFCVEVCGVPVAVCTEQWKSKWRRVGPIYT
jgi:hypothetical protein